MGQGQGQGHTARRSRQVFFLSFCCDHAVYTFVFDHSFNGNESSNFKGTASNECLHSMSLESYISIRQFDVSWRVHTVTIKCLHFYEWQESCQWSLSCLFKRSQENVRRSLPKIRCQLQVNGRPICLTAQCRHVDWSFLVALVIDDHSIATWISEKTGNRKLAILVHEVCALHFVYDYIHDFSKTKSTTVVSYD